VIEEWRGADVIVNSWQLDPPFEELNEAYAYASTSGRGGLGVPVFASSGNDGSGSVTYPAKLDSVIAVGATTNRDQRASYSQYGAELDLVAPGGDASAGIVTVDRKATDGYNRARKAAGNYTTLTGASSVVGTSFAAPLAAGVAALMLSLNPELTADQVRTILIGTADKVGGVGYDPVTGFHEQYGYGRVNAGAAVASVSPDTTGPYISGNPWAYYNPADHEQLQTGQRFVLYVPFSERTIWSSEDIAVKSPTDVTIVPDAIYGSGTRLLRIVLPTLTESGTYDLELNRAGFHDQAGNAWGTGTQIIGLPLELTPVAAPTTPDLIDSSDSGNGRPGTSTDNITKDTTPTVEVTLGVGGEATALWAIARRIDKGIERDVVYAQVSVQQGVSTYELTLPELEDGVYKVYARAGNSGGDISADSSPLTVTIDTAATAPVVYVKTVSGKPRVYGTVEPLSVVELWRGKTKLASNIAANALGKWYFNDGKYSKNVVRYKARFTDAAGNRGPVGPQRAYPPESAPKDAAAKPLAFSAIGDDGPDKGNGAYTDDTTLVLHGYGPPNYTVTVSLDGVGTLGTTVIDAAGVWTFDYTGTSLSPGTYTFTATAQDSEWETPLTADPFEVHVGNEDPRAPMIGSLLFPGSPEADPLLTGETTALGSWRFEGWGEPGAYVRVKATDGLWTAPVLVGDDGIWHIDYSPSELTRNVAVDFVVQEVTGSGTPEDPYVPANDLSPRFRITYDDVAPTLVHETAVPDPDDPVVDSIELAFSEPVYGLDEVQLILSTPYDSYLLGSEQTPWTEDNVHWIVPNLSGYTDLEGEYQLSIMPEQYVVDATGNAWSGGFPPFFVITGTNDGETFLLEEDPFHTGIIRITITGNGSRQVLTQPEQIIINALDGDDELINHLPPDLLPEAGIFFRGGDGTDRVELHGTSADDVITYGDDEAVHSHDDDYGIITAEDVEDWTLVISDGADDVSVWGGTLNITGTGPWGEGSALHIDGGVVQLDADAGDGSNKTLTINVNDEGSVIFTTTQHLAALNVNDGGEAIVAAGGDKMIVAGALNVGQYGLLDLKDNDLLVGSADVADVRGWIVSAYDGGTWQGYGITSTWITPGTHALAYSAGDDAAINWMGGSFGGESFGSSAVLVKYTYAGDANLDGMVDVVDLGILSTNWQQYGGWTRADFNYSGFVDIVDMGILSTNWQKGVGDPLRMGDGFLETLLSAEFAKLLEQQDVLDWLSAGADGLLE